MFGLTLGRIPKLYCIWAVLSTAFAIAIANLSAESVTRLAVLAFLFVQLALRKPLCSLFPQLSPKKRFVILGTCLAAVVEGFHMISTPVFLSLRFTRGMAPDLMLRYYLIDLLYTLPAYLVILSVIWYFTNRYQYSLWQYILTMGLGQTLGDGAMFYFLAAPWMLFFLPYPMSNYHAINIIPHLATRDALPPNRIESWARYLALPGIILTYLFCGSIIKIIGKSFGFE